jgi:predicted NAD/FAD-dependent oxidoreductase
MSKNTVIPTAIIGAGISGLACARVLENAGHPVTLFEKSRGPGGRMSSRRLDDAVVELGAQFFSVRDETFRREADSWRQAGITSPWPTRLWQSDENGWQRHEDRLERFIGQPRMSAITEHMADGLPVMPGIRIEQLEKDGEDWWLLDQDQGRHGPFVRVVISAPSPQAKALLAAHDPGLAEECDAVIQQPCWAAWARFDAPMPSLAGVDDDWQAVRMAGEPLRFVSRNDHKPGRETQGESLSLLAHIEWSRAHLEDAADSVARRLLDAFAQSLPDGIALPEPASLGAHRWRYAQPDVFAQGEAVNRDYRLADNGLALCGDGWRGPRVEDAWLSGHHLGQALVAAAATPAD